MKTIEILIIGLAGNIGSIGCVADSPTASDAQAEDRQAEVAATPAKVDPRAIGSFHTIRLANTNECLQLIGDAIVGLQQCSPSLPAQNWLTRPESNGSSFRNDANGNCLWASGNKAVTGDTIFENGCNGSNSSAASNAMWKPSRESGFATLQSELGHHDTGFCLDAPNAFDGAAVQLARCDGRPSEIWIINVE